MSNVTSFSGRLTKDSEVRFAPTGTAFCNFTVASDFGYGDNGGTNFLECVIIGKRAEGKLPEYLKKGQEVHIIGELQIKSYEDKEGVNRKDVKIIVDKLDLMGGSKTNHGQASHQQQDTSDSDPFGQPPF